MKTSHQNSTFVIAIIWSMMWIPLHGQNKINQYEYWFDDNHSGKVVINVVPAVSTYNLEMSIPAAALTPGIHRFSIRFKDDSLNYSPALTRFFISTGNAVSSSTRVHAYEYWFDTGYSTRIGGTSTGQEGFAMDTGINTVSLAEGLHTYHIRFQDGRGTWSPVKSSFFMKVGNETNTANGLTTLQYWFDGQYDDKTEVNLGGTTLEQISQALDADNLSPGMHIVHFRIKDWTGVWSPIKSQIFIKSNISGEDNFGIEKLQYWFDNQYTANVLMELGGGNEELILSDIDVAALSNGLHALHLRAKNKTGIWSPVKSQFFIKRGNAQTKPSDVITAYRYWFDNKFQQAVTTAITGNLNPIELLSPIDMTRIRKGFHTFHIQFMDNQGVWSVPVFKNIEKIPYPIAEFTALNNGICPGDTILFDNTSVDGDTYNWTFGDGQISTDSLPSHIYTAGGSFTVGLTVTDLSYNLDSTLIKPQYIVAEGKIVYSSPDSVLGSLRNVIRCAQPNDVIGFTAELDTLSLESPIAVNKNLLLQNNNADPAIIMGNFMWPGFSGSYDLIHIPHGIDASFTNLQFIGRNMGSGNTVLHNNGNTVLDNIVVKGNGINLIKNEKEQPSNNTNLTIQGTIMIKQD
ncbi:MAG: PKD domain-containing protein [Saprospiraceae bacterium]|nr:PKD domain-containing protein [Saprospiraceae bacterium]